MFHFGLSDIELVHTLISLSTNNERIKICIQFGYIPIAINTLSHLIQITAIYTFSIYKERKSKYSKTENCINTILLGGWGA